MRASDVHFVLHRVDAAVAPIHQTLEAINVTLVVMNETMSRTERTLGTLVDSIADLRSEFAAHTADGHGGES